MGLNFPESGKVCTDWKGMEPITFTAQVYQDPSQLLTFSFNH